LSCVRFQLLSRPACHLCDEMEEVLAAVLPSHGEDYVVEDVDSRPEWRRRFGEVIPVLLRDGKPVAKLELDRQRLERIVRQSRARAGARWGPFRNRR